MSRKPFDPSNLTRFPASESDFIAALVRQQEKGGLDDTAFAAELGVSDSLWRHTRAGRLPLGIKLLMAGSELVSHSVYEAAQASLLRRERGRPSKPSEDAA